MACTAKTSASGKKTQRTLVGFNQAGKTSTSKSPKHRHQIKGKKQKTFGTSPQDGAPTAGAMDKEGVEEELEAAEMSINLSNKAIGTQETNSTPLQGQ
jgi:hypothetical protein